MQNKKPNILFVAVAYAFFWVLLIGAVGLFSGNQELFPNVMVVVQVVGTWAPTFALLVLFKRLYPGWTIGQFYRKAFSARLNLKLLLVATIALISIAAVVVGIGTLQGGGNLFSLLSFSISGLVITLFSGAMGEESGWRGHLQQSMEKNHSVIKSSLIVGVIWAFWHTPTWLNYLDGLAYLIPLDILNKISFGVILGICYSRCRNLFVPMWIHFVANIMFNGMQPILLDVIVWYVLLQVLLAAGYIAWFKRIGAPIRQDSRETGELR